VILKHSDRATSAIPDVTVTWWERTFWIENKHQKKGQSLDDINKTDQLIMCNELAMASGGRCWISIYRDDPKDLTIWQPRVLAAHLWPKIILGELSMEPAVITDLSVNVFNVLKATGSIRCSGWNHELQRRLMIDAH
jgi:hypothetical protein